MKFTASIIIPTYNSSELLNQTLNSIVKQNIDIQTIETIVVNDGSSDNTKEVVDSYKKLMNVKYFYQEDLGNRTARARNIGIENSESDILIFIDSGVLLGTNCIREHIKIHWEHNLNCAVIGYVYGFDQYSENLDRLKRLINHSDLDKTISYMRRNNLFPDMRDVNYKAVNYELDTLPAPWAYFLTCNVSLSRSIFESIGLFDERFDLNWGVEDIDLGYRIFLNKTSFIIGRLAEAIHYPHDTQENMGQKFQEEIANKQKFYRKYLSEESRLFGESTFMELNSKILSNGLKV